jgi:hypothetical protein
MTRPAVFVRSETYLNDGFLFESVEVSERKDGPRLRFFRAFVTIRLTMGRYLRPSLRGEAFRFICQLLGCKRREGIRTGTIFA